MKYIVSFLFILMVLISGCRSDYGVTKTGMEAWVDARSQTALESDTMSGNTKDFLLREGVYADYCSSPEKTVKKLSEKLKTTTDRKLLSVLIELTYLQAKKCRDIDRSAYYYLSSCIYAYAYLFKNNFSSQPSPFEPEYIFACRFYNYSAARIFQYIIKKKLLFSSNVNMPFLNGFVNLKPIINHLPHKMSDYQSFEICYNYTAYGFHSFTRQAGLGVPIVAVGPDALGKEKNKIFDVSKKAMPGTLFLHFDFPAKGKFNAVMEFYDPMKTDMVEVGEHKVPLELDLTTYLGGLLRSGPAYSPVSAMRNTAVMDTYKGLYMLTKYDKDKIPVVFVHGVLSYPRTWVQTINSLLKDSVIRQKYQFWLFAYPTGNPILYSAEALRRELKKACLQFNPEKTDFNFNQMVIVSHSMGGLLSKTLIQHSGDMLLNEVTEGKPLDYFNLNEKQKEFITKFTVFNRLPFVKRVIFISVPHKGSIVTRWWVAEIAATFINMPGKLTHDLYKIKEKMLIKTGFKDDQPIKISTGVDNLDPDNRFLKAIDKLPFDNNVKYHSIMGNNEKAGVPGGTDGIVPYSSAHLDAAESELIVKSDHSAHVKPLAIKEIKRILLQHLQEVKLDR